jgi:hypothetical protein
VSDEEAALLEMLQEQARAFQQRLASIESRIALGEKVSMRQACRIAAAEARADEHEEAIVDIRVAAMQFAKVAEDMQRLTEAIQRDIKEERQA